MKQNVCNGQHKGIDWDRQPLGHEPDTVIARRLNVQVRTVRLARCRRGIAAFPVRTNPGSKGIVWNTQPLGQMSDYALAKLLGVSKQAVNRARNHRGIPAYGSAAPLMHHVLKNPADRFCANRQAKKARTMATQTRRRKVKDRLRKRWERSQGKQR